MSLNPETLILLDPKTNRHNSKLNNLCNKRKGLCAVEKNSLHVWSLVPCFSFSSIILPSCVKRKLAELGSLARYQDVIRANIIHGAPCIINVLEEE